MQFIFKVSAPDRLSCMYTPRIQIQLVGRFPFEGVVTDFLWAVFGLSLLSIKNQVDRHEARERERQYKEIPRHIRGLMESERKIEINSETKRGRDRERQQVTA